MVKEEVCLTPLEVWIVMISQLFLRVWRESCNDVNSWSMCGKSQFASWSRYMTTWMPINISLGWHAHSLHGRAVARVITTKKWCVHHTRRREPHVLLPQSCGATCNGDEMSETHFGRLEILDDRQTLRKQHEGPFHSTALAVDRGCVWPDRWACDRRARSVMSRRWMSSDSVWVALECSPRNCQVCPQFLTRTQSDFTTKVATSSIGKHFVLLRMACFGVNWKLLHEPTREPIPAQMALKFRFTSWCVSNIANGSSQKKGFKKLCHSGLDHHFAEIQFTWSCKPNELVSGTRSNIMHRSEITSRARGGMIPVLDLWKLFREALKDAQIRTRNRRHAWVGHCNCNSELHSEIVFTMKFWC